LSYRWVQKENTEVQYVLDFDRHDCSITRVVGEASLLKGDYTLSNAGRLKEDRLSGKKLSACY
jgi:hypothetical protein